MSAEENITFKDFDVSKGGSWSSERAISASCKVVGKDGEERKVEFFNRWDESVPHAKEWRDSLDVKIDFSDVSLSSSKEDVEKKKEEMLKQYSTPSNEDMAKSLAEYKVAKDEYSAQTYVWWMYDAATTAMQISGKENFEKSSEYVGKLIDNVIDYQNMKMGEKSDYKDINEIETPFRTRMDKFLGRSGWDPCDTIKDGVVQDFGECTPLVVRGLKEVKDILPKNAEEIPEVKDKREIFKEHFGDKFNGYEQLKETEKAFMGHIVQFGIKDNVAQAFDKQLAEHLSNLEKEKRKEELASKKEEIKTRLEDMKKTKETEPLSGVVVADRIAEHNIHKKALFDKDKELGIIGKDEKEKMMTPKEGNELAQKIQKSVLEQKKNRG